MAFLKTTLQYKTLLRSDGSSTSSKFAVEVTGETSLEALYRLAEEARGEVGFLWVF